MIRGGGGNEVDGLMTFCHDARKGRYLGSHWPNHVRASALLDQSEVSALPWLILADASHRVVAEGFSLDELDAQLQQLGQ
jgi:hypothetical protein